MHISLSNKNASFCVIYFRNMNSNWKKISIFCFKYVSMQRNEHLKKCNALSLIYALVIKDSFFRFYVLKNVCYLFYSKYSTLINILSKTKVKYIYEAFLFLLLKIKNLKSSNVLKIVLVYFVKPEKNNFYFAFVNSISSA